MTLPRTAAAAVTTIAAVAMLAVAVVSAVTIPAERAVAQEERPEEIEEERRSRQAGMRLASQTPWVAPEGEFQLRVRVSERLVRAGNELAVVVYQRLRSRSAFALTLEDRVLSSVVDVTRDDITKLTRDAAGAFWLRLPVSAGGRAPEPGSPDPLVLRREGVYPVRVEVREEGGGQVLAGLTTHLVRVPDADGLQPLSVAWVQPVGAPPAHSPGGEIGLKRSDREQLEATIDALGRPLPLTVAPLPETIAALAAAGGMGEELVSTIASTLEGRQVIGGPFAPITLPTLLALDLEDEAVAHLARGSQALSEHLDVRADNRTWLASRYLDRRTIGTLGRLGVDRLVVPDEALEPLDLTLTLTNPFFVEGSAGRLHEAAVADPGLATHFPTASSDDPVLRAHQLLADLAVLYFDSPGRERGVVVVPPDDSAAFGSFVSTVFQALRSAPMLEAVTLDDFFDRVPFAEASNDSPLVREPVADELPRLGVAATAIRASRARLTGFASMVEAASPVVRSIETQLLLATAAHASAAQRREYLAAADAALDREAGAIQAASQGITLTAREGTIPLTIQNLAGYPVTVAVALDSDKLDFSEASILQLRELHLEQRNTTVEIDVRARTSGAFPLLVTVTSPDGRLTVAESRLTVRSRVVSGVGLLLMGGAGLFLLVWWGNHIRTGRRDRRLVNAPAA